MTGFLLFRVLKMGKDDRFDHIRTRFFPFLGFWVGKSHQYLYSLPLLTLLLSQDKLFGLVFVYRT